jgi:hypothetical protein
LLYLGTRSGVTTHLVVVDFDHPKWDADRVEIFDLRKQSNHALSVDRVWTAGSDMESERFGIDKICRLLESVIGELQGTPCEKTARLDQAVYVQGLLAAAVQKGSVPTRWKGRFADEP